LQQLITNHRSNPTKIIKSTAKLDTGSSITCNSKKIAEDLEIPIIKVHGIDFKFANDKNEPMFLARINLYLPEFKSIGTLKNFPVGILDTQEYKILLGNDLQLHNTKDTQKSQNIKKILKTNPQFHQLKISKRMKWIKELKNIQLSKNCWKSTTASKLEQSTK
jgi:hypothetical protein